MTTFVLVHGAWHGGWCWREVAGRLQSAGHRVFAPTLTGLADRSHLLSRETGLETHILDIVNLLAWEELDDAVLCGHSYGGMVVTGAADRAAGRLRALVYLDAFVPADDVSGMLREGNRRLEGPPLPISGSTIRPAPAEGDAASAALLHDPLPLTGAWRTVGRMLALPRDSRGRASDGCAAGSRGRTTMISRPRDEAAG